MKPSKGDRVRVRMVVGCEHHGFTPGDILEGTYEGPDSMVDCDVIRFSDGQFAGTGYDCEILEILS